MSAEKEIVNYWYNKKGFFTLNNIKASNNRDCGILAIRFENDKISEILHIEVSCSITNNISETTKLEKSVGKIISEKFDNKSVTDSINNHIKNLSVPNNKIIKIMVLGAVPKSRKAEITKEFCQKNVEVVEFENILYDVLENLDTQYYKNDIIRTMQLTKFLLLSEPTKIAKLLVSSSSTSNSRKEFLSSLLDKDEIMKEFKKTNSERLGMILKNSNLRPSELAEMLDQNILNNKTRKLFMDSFMAQEKTRKVVNKTKRVRKLNAPLGKFF